MVITFLIGNGFDIACGMDTSYGTIKKSYTDNVKNEYSSLLKKHFDDKKEDWADFEEGIYKNAKEFNSIDQLIGCIEDFERYLLLYIGKKEKEFERLMDEDTLWKLERETGKMISNFWEIIPPEKSNIFKVKPEEPRIVNFISLNYSLLLNKILSSAFPLNNAFYGKASKYCKNYFLNSVVNLHGKYLNPQSIVLGVDNENQFLPDINKLNDFQKTFLIKRDFINAYDSSNEKEAQEILNNTEILCIFGCTLGGSDLRIKNKILEWFNNNKDAQIVKYYNPVKCALPNHGAREIEKEKQLIENFINEMGIEPSDENKNRIHIPLSYDIFQFKSIFKKNDNNISTINNDNS